MSCGFVDVSSRRTASLYRGGEDVSDRLEDTAYEPALSGNECLVAIGVVKQGCKERPEWPPCHALAEAEESCHEIILEIVADAR